MGSLLEIGTGFHPELTGRENIFLNGAILGMRRTEIAAKFDEIVAFAEVERFIDTPVKHFSSGMYVRLAFAVAAHLTADILIVDEVLAVGDAQFQKKCLGKMGEVASQGRTVLFVSHNMSTVVQLCNRGLLLNAGQIVSMGPIGNIVDAYQKTLSEETAAEMVFPEQPDSVAQFTRFSMSDIRGNQARVFSSSDGFTIEVEYAVNQTLQDDHIFILIDRADGLLILKAADDDFGRTTNPVRPPGRYRTSIRFPGNILNEGVYQFRLVMGKRHGVQYDARTGFSFEIEDWNDYTNSSFGKRNGALLLPLEWIQAGLPSQQDRSTE
jgi:lipopolysaccharide transport system ATP-binding protein